MNDMAEGTARKSLAPVDGGEAQGTTTFTTSVQDSTYDNHMSSLDPMNDHDLEVDDIRDIADFLSKPMPVASGTFTTANVAGDLLYSSDIFTLFNAQSIWTNKIQGFLNMRGNVKFRLVINPTPFQAGLLRLGYLPCTNLYANNEAKAHLLNRVLISQIPGTYLNLNNNFVEVTVPYVAPTSFLERDQVGASNHVSWGTVYLHVMEPLRTGTGPTSINYTLWMSIEDLELSGMVQPQMADPPKKRKGRGMAPQDSEANSGKGPITRIMSSGVQLANDLSAIPALAPVTRPASWVLSAIGSLCESFGWSKPTVTDGPCKQVIGQNHYMMNSKGNDDACPMSLDPDNKITVISDAAPGGMDEMSFNFIKSRWSFFTDLTWDTTQVSGTKLIDKRISPFNFLTSQVVGTELAFSQTPATIFSELYDNYRGSFEIRLRLVKTGFHTGTLAVGFVPGQAAVVPSYNDSAYVYRQIIDIQDGSEFVFNLPYMIPQDYLKCDEYSGCFFIYVVNPLVAPATVSSSIDVFMEVRGGNDLTYSVPRGVVVSPFVPQGIDNEEQGESTAITLGSRVHLMKDVHHAQLSVGDVQLSILELCKAYYPLLFTSAAAGVTGGNGAFYLANNRIYSVRYNGVSLTSSELGGDLLSFVSSWYAFSRGSTRWRVLPLTPATNSSSFRAIYLSDSGADAAGASLNAGQTYWSANAPNALVDSTFSGLIGSANPSTYGGYSNRFYQAPPVNSGLAVQAPFYSKWRYSMNHLITDVNQYRKKFTPNSGTGFYIPSTSKCIIARAAGDDFQLSYFIGTTCYCGSVNYFKNNS